MPGKEVKVGPWPGGVNFLDEPDHLQDSQLAWAVNFDIDNKGVLIPRRNLEHQIVSTAPNTDPKYILGSAILDGEVRKRVLVARFVNSTSFFHAVDNPVVGNTRITSSNFVNSLSGLYRSVVQYQNKLWYVPAAGGSLGQSSPAGLTNTFTPVSAMPYGDYGFVLKDRMFIVRKATSELFFSKATDFTNWTAPDGGVIKVNPGDNRPITKVLSVNNQIIIFKRDETYVLNFNNSPTGDGSLRQVSADQGAIDAIVYRNEVYCFSSMSIFKFVNNYFQDIGTQLNLGEVANLDRFQISGQVGVAGKLHVVGNTLILGYGQNRAFAMNLDTGSWSMYEVDTALAGVFAGASVSGRGSTEGQFVVFGDGSTRLYSMFVERKISSGRNDYGADGQVIPIKYEFASKVYDFDDSNSWKRLYNWYADIKFPTIYQYGNVWVRYNDTTTDLDGRPVNEIPINARGDLIGPFRSARFRTVQFGFTGLSKPTVSTRTATGPTIRNLKIVVNPKNDLTRTLVP